VVDTNSVTELVSPPRLETLGCIRITGMNGGIEHMSNLPNCPKCNSEYTYEDGSLFVCPVCAHEWNLESETENNDQNIVKDSNGNVLTDGDSITVIKDLKVKGSSSVLKAGTKVKNIRLVDGDHNIDCKIDGFGAMSLKSEFVKKL
jgi:protein PhnA